MPFIVKTSKKPTRLFLRQTSTAQSIPMESYRLFKLWAVKFIDVEDERISDIQPGGTHGMRQS